MKQRSDGEVTTPYELRPIIGRAMVNYIQEQGHFITSLSVGKVHAHGLVELPRNLPEVRRIIGEAKRKSSREVKKQLPGSIWSAGLRPTPVGTREHMRKAYDYILYEHGPGAWTWSCRDNSLEGMFNRKRPKNQKNQKNPGRRCALPRRSEGINNTR